MTKSLGRSSLSASAATFAARIIGFGRNIALAAAIGTGLVADSYNIANQVPNQIFLLLGGGTIATIFVPQLVKHAKRSPERSDDYASLLIYGGTIFGIFVTVLLLTLSPALISVMGGSAWGKAQSELAFQLSMWCIPQLFFLAIFAVASQIMNAKGHFTAVAWLPATNSAIVILSCLPIIAVGAVQANSPGSMSSWSITLLGGSTLAGAAAQSLLLMIMLARSGFRMRFRFRVRGLGLKATAAAGLLTVAAASCYQLANLAISAFSTQAGTDAKVLGFEGRGYTAFLYAQLLLAFAQAVASASLATILLQRLSRHYSDGDYVSATRELNDAILRTGALLIPLSALFVCVGPLGTEVLFTRGETSASAAHFIGIVLAVLAVGLVPFALQPLLIRPFYAVHDAKTPLRSAALICTVWITGSFAASVALPSQWVLLGIAGAFSVSYMIDLPLKVRRLRRLGFSLSPDVTRGYAGAIAAGALAALATGIGVRYVESLVHSSLTNNLLFLSGGTVLFFALYCTLTIRSPASLQQLIRWLRA